MGEIRNKTEEADESDNTRKVKQHERKVIRKKLAQYVKNHEVKS